MAEALKKRLENFKTIGSWIAFNKEEVKEVMRETGGFITYCGSIYVISFRLAWKALSRFVFKRSGCKEGDYYVSLVNPHLVKPYREWDK